MAYYHGHVARGSWDYAYCDECAEGNAIPFDDQHNQQSRPWTWAPWKSGGVRCRGCKRDVDEGAIR